MPTMFENAIDAIRMGVEDYQQQDVKRDLSAVRNFYSGILLLAKELLIRSAPKTDPNVIIAARIKFVPDGKGDVIAKADGKSTIDYQQIHTRFKDFDLEIDKPALDNLGRIRNDIEHKSSDHTAVAVRAAITSTFSVVSSLFRQLQEDPAEVLGDTWQTMLQTKDVYDGELKSARDTLAKVKWYSPQIDAADFSCPECDAVLIGQIDEDNADQAHVEFKCRACGSMPEVADMIERAIDKKFSAEVYIRAKETGEDGPVFRCPSCERNSLLEDDEACAGCNEPIDYESECMLCGEHIPLSDYLEGVDGGLCSYHAYQADRVMHE